MTDRRINGTFQKGISGNPGGRVSAANAILDRGWGRPLQSNQHKFEAENPWEEILNVLKNASTEDLERSLKEMDRDIAKDEAQRNPGAVDA